MKIAIVYKSITGNTKLLAEAIKEEVPKADIVYFGEPKKRHTGRFIYNWIMD